MNLPQNLSKKQTEFIEAGLNGNNIFLTGKAGTGKSFVTKELIRLLTKQRKNVVALAPTGIAANNVGVVLLVSHYNWDRRFLNSSKGTFTTLTPSLESGTNLPSTLFI